MDMVPTTMANATIIPLQGQINSMNAQALEAQFLALVHGGARQIVLDCTGLEYISSAGLRVVLVLAKRLKQEGGRLVVCALQPAVHEVFDISGFLSILEVENTCEDALARL